MCTPKLFLLSLALSANLFAQDIQVVGSIEKTLQAPQTTHINSKATTQPIKFLKIHLSERARLTLNKRLMTSVKKTQALPLTRKLPVTIELGMNAVPVLNQGKLGSCVTFANSAAVDAALNKGDYISQLCQLQLGLYLEKNGYNPSGWDGSNGRIVLNQMQTFGIVNKEKQQTIGCGGLTDYPSSEQPSVDTAMSPEQYHQLSENLDEQNIIWSPILDAWNAELDRTDTNNTINEIKVALNEQDRVTFGVLLLDFDLGIAGAVGSHNTQFDTWVLTPEIARDIYLRPDFGGHEMIITGYDDKAIARDEHGIAHQGLFTLRNSWGEQYGDQGNFYMSYDYFKVLVFEAQRIRSFPVTEGDEENTPAAQG